eukprot:8416457-Lingulodinium_polyedra.AAC.1
MCGEQHRRCACQEQVKTTPELRNIQQNVKNRRQSRAFWPPPLIQTLTIRAWVLADVRNALHDGLETAPWTPLASLPTRLGWNSTSGQST